MQRFTRSRKKIYIYTLRFFCGAGRPAEDSGRSHPGVENTFKARVAIDQSAIHCVWRREKFRRFHKVEYEKCNSRESRCAHPRKQSRVFGETFQSLLPA